jgi:hypothetical protein
VVVDFTAYLELVIQSLQLDLKFWDLCRHTERDGRDQARLGIVALQRRVGDGLNGSALIEVWMCELTVVFANRRVQPQLQ